MGIIDLTRSLRKKQTPSEKLLWKYIRDRRLEGKKFVRQYPIYYKNINGKQEFFIADFYCAEHNLVVELDGKVHDSNKEYDEQRDIIIKGKGLSVLRIKNEELQIISTVLDKIKARFI